MVGRVSRKGASASDVYAPQQQLDPTPSKGVRKAHETRQLPVPNSVIAQLPISRWWFEVIFAMRESGLPVLQTEIMNAHRKPTEDAARAFVAMHALNKEFQAAAKEFDALFTNFKERLMPGVLEGAGMTSIPLSTEGARVGVSYQYRASPWAERKEEATAYLAKHFPDIIKQTTNASTLAAIAKELIAEKNLDLPPDLFNVYPQPITSVTKIAGKGATNGAFRPEEVDA